MVGWRRFLVAAVGLAVLGSTAACGGGGGGETTAGTGGSGTGEVTGAPVDGELAAWCSELDKPGPVADNTGSYPDVAQPLFGVLRRYGEAHPDTFGGSWIANAYGGTIVMAFTDDPGPHREAIASLVAQPDDPVVVMTAPVTADDGSVVTTDPPTTTVAEAGTTVDVVQVANAEADLNAIQQQVMPAFDDGALSIMSTGTSTMINRVSIGVAFDEPDPAELDAARRLVAERLPVDAVCVEGGPIEEPPFEMPATMIPSEGSDPLVQCGGGLPMPLSALEDPPELAPDDPLRVAFDQQRSRWPHSSGPEEWYLLVRSGDHATFATGRPPTAFVSMELEGDRWVSTGSGGGGQPCEPVALLPEGLSAIEWSLDASFPAPQPGDTVLHILVNRIECSSGQAVGDDLVGPEVVERDGQVLVAFAAKALPPGSYDCIGPPPTAAEVTLDEPLPAGTIVDGRFLPPRPVESGSGGL